MGNRATVIFTDGQRFSPAVYHHWNGGPESIYGFLEELDRRKQRCDQDYECARYIQLVGEFLDQSSVGSTSLGVSNGPESIDKLDDVMTDHSDNGFYIVNRTVEPMVVRRFKEHYSKDYKTHKLVEMSAEEVKKERKEADANDYRPKFREFFEILTKGKEIEGH